MSFASIEDAWGVPSLSPRASPRAVPAGTPIRSADVPHVADPVPPVAASRVTAAGVREYLRRVYATGGLRGVLRLLTPKAVADIALAPCALASVGVPPKPWWHDPDKLLLLVCGVFVLLLFVEFAGYGRGGVGGVVPSAPPPW